MRAISLRNSELVAIVDDADFDRLNEYRWYLSAGYARRIERPRRGAVKNIAMHNQILGVPGMEADHINGDKLNNRRANLRACTRSQNEAAKPKAAGSSRYKGVYFDSCKQRWRALVQKDGRRRHVGYYRSEDAAARGYDAAATEAFGEFACLNFPSEQGAA